MIAKADKIDAVTAAWIRNPSDEKAARNGCRFDIERGSWTVWWIERFCRLYEGEQAGDPVRLRGCSKCDKGDFEIPEEWNDKTIKLYRKRAEKHAKCVAAGHHIDWQYECTMRCFGWVKFSDKWNREVRRFRESSIWVAKKNKKSPTLAAWSLFLLIGDGEPGQKVYIGAKDGNQARDIGAKHAAEMVRLSPELISTCKINKVVASIEHEESRSVFKPMSSSNSKTQRAKEGINGSVMIDEVHVVDREFISIISRAGISRSEPMFAGFSTAGNDPDGYGKERFDHAAKVLSGEVEDQGLFVAIYAAPQDLSDEDLAKDPLKWGLMANPAMGHTVDPAEYLEDYNKSRKSIRDLADFKMYRLDIWQHSTNPWLHMEDWGKGKRDFTVDSMKGNACWGALDLAAVKDFAAFCLCFPMESEVYRFLWWYWLPEKTAAEYRSKIDIDKWKADPRVNLTLTDGATIHYGYIRSKIRQLAKDFDIQELAYDDWNAEQTTQEIEQGVTDMHGKLVEPATGIVRCDFGQGLREMNEPTKMFEAAVINGKIEHNGDPLTAWMMQNTTVKEDVNGNYRPVKPQRNGIQKIDGAVVAIMARARAAMCEMAPSAEQMMGFF